ncbi:MAG: DUF6090 family protein [Balneolaceae bacterium]|nr:DUF6090 family protein [Balneolaceae bacterium]
MITIFRRIRQKLIDSGSVTKYMVYAIGEILLVVIGILIALQVNNWNEERKQEQEALQVLGDLERSIGSLQSGAFYLMPMVQLDSVHYHIFNKSLKSNLLDNSILENPRSYIINPMQVGIYDGLGWLYNENVEIILENERLFPERYSRILFLVRRLNSAFQTMETVGSRMQEIQQESLEYLSNQEWMYETDEDSFRQRIEFYHTDTYFRNRLRHFNDLNATFTQQYDIYYKYRLLTWLEYQMVVNERNFPELIEHLESFGYERASEVPCNDEVKEDPFHSFYYWSPVYNNTSEPVDLYLFDRITGERRVYYTVQPGELSARFTNNDFPFLQTGSDNSCERQFATNWNNFVVIDP